MLEIHICPKPFAETFDTVQIGVMVQSDAAPPFELWYRVPSRHKLKITDSSDPFVLAVVFLAMEKRANLRVHGAVSPSLLRNLEEFQSAWKCWRPQRYSKIEITADTEREGPIGASCNESDAVAAFSGGVDSLFSMHRHKRQPRERTTVDLTAAVMVHGFDIPLCQPTIFDRVICRSRAILNDLGVEVIPVATNFKDLKLAWEDVCGAAIASCLTLFRGRYRFGILASSEPYHYLVLPWGSNPLTDPFLSSDSFQIKHDGAGFTRTQKAHAISSWPEAMNSLRVCWQGDQLDRNCGRCEKCIRTILNFRASGVPVPKSFDRDVTDRQILAIRGLNSLQIAAMRGIVTHAKSESLSDSWVAALERCIRKNESSSFVRKLKTGTIEEIKKRMPAGIRSRLRKFKKKSVLDVRISSI
jgi:hypothetical protein